MLDNLKLRLHLAEESRQELCRRGEHALRRRLGDRGATTRERGRDVIEELAPPTGAAPTRETPIPTGCTQPPASRPRPTLFAHLAAAA